VHYASLPIIFLSVQVIVLLAIIVSIIAIGSVTTINSYSLETLMFTGPGIVFGFLLIVEFALGATINLITVALAAPLISGEIELKSWELLRATALTLREILLAKLSAIIHQLRLPLAGLFVVRAVCTGAGLFLVFAALMSEMRYELQYGLSEADGEYIVEQWVPIIVAVLVVAVVHFTQPLLQMLMNTVLGMVASAFTRARGRALAAGFGIRLALWGLTSVLGTAGISFTINAYDRWLWTSPVYPENEVVGIAALIILWALIFLFTQIGITFIGWGITVWRSRRLTEMA
jgi:hypothetical protein